MDTRREFIKKAASLAGSAGLSAVLPASIQRALSIDPRAGSSWEDAEHVVILMQENRSFDHCYGVLRGVRGFRDPRAIRLTNGNPVWLQTDEKGDTYGPFRLDIKGTNATWMGSLPHDWTNQADARNEGRYDRWLQAKHSSQQDYRDMPLTLGHYTREDLPFYYALADAFTICDQAFCSSLTGTTPNRLHLWTGTIRDEQRPEVRPRVRNEDTDYELWAHWKTFPERLEENGISWKIYQNEIGLDLVFTEEENAWLANFGDNPLEWFSQFRVKFAPFYRNVLPARIISLKEEIAGLKGQVTTGGADAAQTGGADAAETGGAHAAQTGGMSENGMGGVEKMKRELAQKQGLLKILEADVLVYTQENWDKLVRHERDLHEKAFTTNIHDPHFHDLTSVSYPDGSERREMKVPEGDVLYQFRKDVREGKLPAVSWIVAPEHFSDHPSSAWYGAWYISEAMDILTEDPEVWKKTIFILCYDENDGYFDHVPPFVSPYPNKPGTGLVSEGIDISLEYMSREQDLQKVSESEARGGPIGLGYRVPLVVASPWSRGGYVNSQVFDHTSLLLFLEKFVSNRFGKNIVETNINTWRRTVCGDLVSVFRPYGGEKIDALPFPGKDVFLESIHRAKYKGVPSTFKKLSGKEIEAARHDLFASQVLPQQERGVRPACALPYELYADGNLLAFEDAVSVVMSAGNVVFGDRSAGSPFTIYVNGKAFGTRNYAVRAGDRLMDKFSLADFEQGRYNIQVYGPNGFYRAFTGSKEDPRLIAGIRYEQGKPRGLSGVLRIELVNRSPGREYGVRIRDNAYKSADHVKKIGADGARGGKRMVMLDTRANAGWYDYSLFVEGADPFGIRFAGRVETGRESTSDPAMG
jgi:phospholipase C